MPRGDIRAVVLDAVGTLIHPEPPAAEVYATVGRRFGSGLVVEKIRRRFSLAFARQELADLTGGLRTSEARELLRWRQIVAEVLTDATDPEVCIQVLYQHFATASAWRCAPDTGPVLAELAQRGFLVALASNYDHRLRNVVAGLWELQAARHLVVSSEVGWRKPAHGFFAAVCEVVGVPAGRILFVGDDRQNDFDGPRAFEMNAVLLDPRGSEPADTERLTRLTELLDVLQK